MRSKAHIKSHPLHPILVAFPIAFLSGTLIFDVLAFVQSDFSLSKTAYFLNIAGIVSGLVAAVPGIIDFRYTVPPESSAKKRAVKHGIINTSVILLFVMAFILRDRVENLLIIGIEVFGVVLMTIAGWLGGTLVNRNQIGIDIRYADAGKWTEVHINTEEKKVAVANTDELKINQMKLVHLNGKRIVIAKGDNAQYSAFDDRCTHRGGSLASGALICDTVQCPWHGSQFNIRTGIVSAGPAKEAIKIYRVNVEGNTVFLMTD